MHIKAHSGGKQPPPTSPRSALGGLRARKKVLAKAREILTTSTQSSWGLELVWLPVAGPVQQPWAPMGLPLPKCLYLFCWLLPWLICWALTCV